jgi:hypothetical protein
VFWLELRRSKPFSGRCAISGDLLAFANKAVC